MIWQPTPYPLFFAFAILLSFFIAIQSYRKRVNVPAARPFALLMASITYWILGYAAELSGGDTKTILLGLKASYIGVVFTPVLMLIFVIHYIGREHWLTRRNQLLLTVIPLITLALNWSNEKHLLYYASYELITNGPYLVAHTTPGPWYWVHIAYSYGILLFSTALLTYRFARSTRLYRVQISLIWLGTLIPWFSSILDVFIEPFQYINLAPFSFVFTGVLMGWGLYRLRLIDIAPVARNMLIQNMKDAMLVLDNQNRIVDINPAMLQLINAEIDQVIGQPADNVLETCESLRTALQTGVPPKAITLRVGKNLRCFDMTSITLNYRGQMIVLHDITARIQIEIEIRQANERLSAQLLEIEQLENQLRQQAEQDPLTNLYNRRYLNEYLHKKLTRQQNQTLISIILLDIDWFKTFNDTYGHTTGDLMLQELGQMLQKNIRFEDVACRYGGEEFVILLPNTDTDSAYKRADELRQKFEQIRIETNHQQFSATFSAGVATFPIHGTTDIEILRAADQALYAAKSAGRNCVVACQIQGEDDARPQ